MPVSPDGLVSLALPLTGRKHRRARPLTTSAQRRRMQDASTVIDGMQGHGRILISGAAMAMTMTIERVTAFAAVRAG